MGGCEGNLVTPEGEPPAPNRELFVATRTDADGWKIRFYMFSIDPDSPITPPVEICDLNRDTPGSVWPDTAVQAPSQTISTPRKAKLSGATETLPASLLAFYGAVQG